MALPPESYEKQLRAAEKFYEKAEKYLANREWTKARDFFLQGIEIFRAIKLVNEEAQGYFYLGITFEGEMNYAEALKAYKTALVLRQDLKDPITLANTQKKIARMYLLLRNYTEAHHACQQAIDLLDEQTPSLNLADALYLQGSIYMIEKNPQSASFYFNMIMERVPNIGQFHLIAELFTDLGIALHLLGDFTQSNSYLLQTLRLQQKRQKNKDVILLLKYLAENAKYLNEKEKCCAYLDDALKLIESLKGSVQEYVNIKIDILTQYVDILLFFEDYKNAEIWCDNAITFAESQNHRSLMFFLYKMGRILTGSSKGDKDSMETIEHYLQEASELANQTQTTNLLQLIMIQRIRIVFFFGKKEDCLKLLQEFNNKFPQIDDSYVTGEFHEIFGLYYHAQGNNNAALNEFKISLKEFQKTSNFGEIAGSHYNIACIYAITHNLESAIENLRKAFQLNPRFKKIALADEDLKGIQNDAPFRELIEK